MSKKILDGEIGYDIKIADILSEKSFLISSPGGILFEGLAMFDAVKNSDIEVGGIGIVASAATLPLLASSKRWGTPNSRYLIHNPWSVTIGTADEMQQEAQALKDEEKRALNIYVENLAIPADEIETLMRQDKIIDANEALRIGLIKEIRNLHETKEIDDQSAELVATDPKSLFTNFKMLYSMDAKQNDQMSGINEKLNVLLSTVKKLFVEPKMLVLQDVNGVQIDFPELETEDQIAEGSTATIDGSPAEGSHEMPDGKTVVFEGGKVTEINEPQEDENETEALKVENETLQAENEQLKASNEAVEMKLKEQNDELSKIKNQLEAALNEFSDFKNQFSEEKTEINTPTTEKVEKKKFSYKRKN